ncbi:MAG: hypothetical protein COB66_05555 [Coxiella sp. (in: Bacteria)]|nr:MAG: hypothetical protein COB66_05555 [Coxiella sp. (in: g-proteobacteria)]
MLNLLFTPRCPICQSKTKQPTLLCAHCHTQLPWQESFEFYKQGISCYAPLTYDNQIKHFIKALKYKHQLRYAALLGNYLAQAIQTHYNDKPQLIIPVPLHKKRLRERGFNQSLELAKVISRSTQIPINKTYFIRKKNTPPQAQCSKSSRKRNIKNAFTLQQQLPAQHIILLDDVITTGGTVIECFNTLHKKQPSLSIDIWAVAKAL